MASLLLKNIPDEYKEFLTDVVDEVNGENNPTQVTVSEYAANIINGWIENQMRGEYIALAQNDTMETLKQKLGSAKDLKAARKTK